jgi:hypothetical protein
MFEIITITIFFVAAPFFMIALCHNSQEEETQLRERIAAKSIDRNTH